MDDKYQMNDKTEQLIRNWHSATNRKKEFENLMIQARQDEIKATDELGKWVCPSDAKPGEKFCIWSHGIFIEVTVPALSGNTHYIIKERPGKIQEKSEEKSDGN